MVTKHGGKFFLSGVATSAGAQLLLVATRVLTSQRIIRLEYMRGCNSTGASVSEQIEIWVNGAPIYTETVIFRQSMANFDLPFIEFFGVGVVEIYVRALAARTYGIGIGGHYVL